MIGSFELIILKPWASISAHCLDSFPWCIFSSLWCLSSSERQSWCHRDREEGSHHCSEAIAQVQAHIFWEENLLRQRDGRVFFLGFPKPHRLAFTHRGSMGDEWWVSDSLWLLKAPCRNGFPASTGFQELPPCPRGSAILLPHMRFTKPRATSPSTMKPEPKTWQLWAMAIECTGCGWSPRSSP